MRYDLNQNDTDPPIRMNLSDERGPAPLTGADVTFIMEQQGVSSPKIVTGPMVILTPDPDAEPPIVEGDVEYVWRADRSDTDVPGVYRQQVRVLYAPGTPQERQETFPSGEGEDAYNVVVITEAVGP